VALHNPALCHPHLRRARLCSCKVSICTKVAHPPLAALSPIGASALHEPDGLRMKMHNATEANCLANSKAEAVMLPFLEASLWALSHWWY
jgi:hypothetical protein